MGSMVASAFTYLLYYYYDQKKCFFMVLPKVIKLRKINALLDYNQSKR